MDTKATGSQSFRVRTSLIGTTELLLHNVQLADPDNYWVKLKRPLIDKGTNKTEEDRLEIMRIEWHGALYLGANGAIVMPTGNIRKCFQETAKITRGGKAITRAVNLTAVEVPLIFEGPADPDALWGDARFRNITLVGIGDKRTPRCRPRFFPWACEAEFEFLPDIMDFDEFKRIVELAGRVEGLGDNRVGGCGRFLAEVVKL